MKNKIVKTPIDQMREIAATLEQSKADALIGHYAGLMEELGQYVGQVKAIVVTSAEDESMIQRAKDGHKVLSKILKDAEEKRKELKAEAKKQTDAIDGIGRVFKSVIEPMLDHLKTQRDFVKIQEEKRLAEEAKREKEELEKLRLEKERIYWEEQRKIRAENDRLRQEKEAAEREAAKARKALQEVKQAKETTPQTIATKEEQCTCPNCGYKFTKGELF